MKLDSVEGICNYNPGEVYAGKTSLSPELTLVEFISTSAAFHGVTSQLLTSLEEDLLKVIFCPLPQLMVLFKGVSKQCDASQRCRLVHGQEEVLHERALRPAAAPLPPEEVP